MQIKEMKAGQRLRAMRELMGITRKEFGEVVGISYDRLTSLELGRQHMVDDDFEKVLLQWPQFAHWLTYAGDIDMKNLQQQRDELLRVVCTKLQVGMVPNGYGLERFKTDTGES